MELSKTHNVDAFEYDFVVVVEEQHDVVVVRVRNVSYWKAVKDGEIVSTGTHKDVLERQDDGSYKFVERIITHTWSK